MSHDKIKAAARERMAHTGEPYAAARRQVIAEIRAAAAAHEELGPEYSDAVVASFLERVEEEIDARVDARMAEARRPDAPAGQDRRHVQLRGIAIGVLIGLFVAVAVGGSPDERLHRRVLVLAAVALTIAVTYAVGAARAWRRLANQRDAGGQFSSRPGFSSVSAPPRRRAAPSARAGRTAP